MDFSTQSLFIFHNSPSTNSTPGPTTIGPIFRRVYLPPTNSPPVSHFPTDIFSACSPDSNSHENSTSSLALPTNSNTIANSSSADTTIPNSVNPYFPSILPQPTHSVEDQTTYPDNLNTYRCNHLRS
ncbi:hypothetical protein Pst134EB_008410 [Puccinia striiformis f. sp. tritici]|nr:hypothetical protein Pst134EB_008410 [Puccinia striiformis f. sp. tritici]